MERVTGYIGRRAIASIIHMLDLIAFAFRMFAQLRHRPKAGRVLMWRIIVQQLYFTAVQALPILIPIALLIGCMVVIQFSKLSGHYDLSRLSVLMIVRETGPIITAQLVILRSATAVTIEISYMRVLKELDAIEMAGLDPLRFVCLPRLVGITSAMVGLFIAFDVVAILGGWAIVWTIAPIPMSNYLSRLARAVTVADISVGLIKALLFGIVITVTCLYRGLEAKDQITDVPVATSRSSVECFLYCLMLNVFISVVFYL